MLPTQSPIAIIIRLCTFCQLLAGVSLIFACQRAQILLLFTGSQSASSDKINYILNTLILIGPGVLAVVYPEVGKLAGLLGAVGGCLCIYILPVVTFLAQKRTEISNPDLIKAIRRNTFSIKQPTPDKGANSPSGSSP